MWLVEDELHREAGPAIEWGDGIKEWWLNGVKVTRAAVMNHAKQLAVAQVEALPDYAVKKVVYLLTYNLVCSIINT
jgi:hypothetical protein